MLVRMAEGRHDWFRTRRDGGSGVEALRAGLLRHSYGRHAHATCAVGVAEAGSQTFRHGRSVYRTRPGSVLLFEPFDLHDGHATTEAGVVYRMLYPDPGQLEAAAREQGARGVIGFRAPLADDRALARAIFAYGRALDGGDPLACDERYHALVAQLVRFVETGPAAECGGAEGALARVREEMHASLAEPLTIRRLAATAGLGRFRLIRAFHRRFGMPPSAYLRTLRLEAAKRLLGAGTRPAAAAAAAGFTDQSHLTRLFKSAYGVTPGAYRAALAGA